MFRVFRFYRTGKITNNHYRYTHANCIQLIKKNNNELNLIRKELEYTKIISTSPIIALHNIFTNTIMLTFGIYIFAGIFYGSISLICYLNQDENVDVTKRQ